MNTYTVNGFEIKGKTIAELEEFLSSHGYKLVLRSEIRDGTFTPPHGQKLAVVNKMRDETSFDEIGLYSVDFFNGVTHYIMSEFDSSIYMDSDGGLWIKCKPAYEEE